MRTPRGKRTITWAAITIAILAIAGVTFARQRAPGHDRTLHEYDRQLRVDHCRAGQQWRGGRRPDASRKSSTTGSRGIPANVCRLCEREAMPDHLDGDVIALPSRTFRAVVDDGGNVIASSRDAFAAGNIGNCRPSGRSAIRAATNC